MNGTDTRFTGSIPETYDRLMGPRLFAPYAADLAARARALGAGRVVEVAAGTGIATRALAAAMPEARIEATDLNQAMILERDPRRLLEAVEAATRALRTALGDGAVDGSMRAFVFTAS